MSAAGNVMPVGMLILVGMLISAGTATGLGNQSSPKAAILEQQGWAAIKAGKAQAAIDAFVEAISLDPKNPVLRLGAGTAEFLARHDPEAKAHLEQALVLDATLTRARAQLAQVVKRQGDVNEAIRLYEIVAAEVPTDEGVRDALDRWKRERELHDRMRLEVGDFFTVSFEGADDGELAARAIDSLNRAYWRICDLFGLYPPKSVPVVLYTGEQFQDITRSPKWAAASFDGIIRIPMRGAGEKGEDLDRVLAHEFTHALIRSVATRGLPTWLNEGLASVLERDDMSWANTVVSQTINPPSLAQLAGPFAKFSNNNAKIAYAVSAVAARRLLDEAGPAAVAHLLRDLGNGVDFESAFLHRIQKTLADFSGLIKN